MVRIYLTGSLLSSLSGQCSGVGALPRWTPPLRHGNNRILIQNLCIRKKRLPNVSSGHGIVMSKRCIVDCGFSKVKKQCIPAASNIKFELQSVDHLPRVFLQSKKLCEDDSGLDPSMTTVPLLADDKDSTCAADNFEDSGIQVTPDVNRLLACRPNLPGFVLNQPKSFPAPNFDVVSPIQSDSFSSTKLSDHKNLGRKVSMGTEIQSVTNKPIFTNCEGKQDVTLDVHLESSHVADKIGQSLDTELLKSNLSESKAETEVLVAVASNVSNNGLKDHNMRTRQREIPTNLKATERYDLHRHKKYKGDRFKQELVSGRKTFSSSRHNQEPVSYPKKKKMSANAVESDSYQEKLNSRSKASKTTAQTDARQKELASHLSSSMKGRRNTSLEQNKKSTLGLESKKKKQTVLPPGLLNQVVRTVQENVETISEQIVAALPVVQSASETNSKAYATEKIQDVLPVSESCTCAEYVANSTTFVTDFQVACKALTSSGGIHDPETKDQSDEECVVKENTQSGECLSCKSLKEKSDILSDTTEHKILADVGKDEFIRTFSLDCGKDSETKLSEVLPFECVDAETTNSSGVKKKKKARKRRKIKGQQQSVEGDPENLLDVLPRYIPDNDVRLNRTKEDNVYNLSALFSGKLASGQPSKTKSRPNYFFAIQITNPEVKAGLLAVQQAVEKACPKLKPAFVSVDSAHLTLAVMHLPDEQAVAKAMLAMDEFIKIYKQGKQHTEQRQLQQVEEVEEQEAHLQRVEEQQNQRQQLEGEEEQEMQEPQQQAEEVPRQQRQEEQQQFEEILKQQRQEQLQQAEEVPKQQKQEQQQVEEILKQQRQEQLQQAEEVPKQQRQEQQQAEEVPKQQKQEQQQVEEILKQQRQEQQQQAEGAVEEARTADPMVLEVKGLDNFRDSVVFAKVTNGAALDHITHIATLLRRCIEDQNIAIDPKPFAAHITLMKTSKNPGKLRAAGIKKIDSKLYQAFSAAAFGSNPLSTIQLCSMIKPKQKKYYFIEHEVLIS